MKVEDSFEVLHNTKVPFDESVINGSIDGVNTTNEYIRYPSNWSAIEKNINKIDPSLNIIFKPLPEDDPKRRNPDISKAKKILNWEPNMQLSDGLDKTIEYFRNLK